MIYETKKYIDVLTKFKITPNQFLFCWLVYNKQWEELKQYLDALGSFDASEINDLVDKDLVLRIGKNKQITPADIHITEKFAHEMIVSDDDAWDELFSKYPSKVKVNGTLYPSKGIKLSEEKELREKYINYIKKNKYKHVQIIALIEKWAIKNNGYALFKIDKFIISQYWNDLETERDNDYATTPIF